MTSVPPLVSTDWLANHLDDENLRILDATVLVPEDKNLRPTADAGRQKYEQAHIPGALYVDLLSELSSSHPELYFVMPDEQQFAEVMGSVGISNDTSVVVYSSAYTGWATRLWWLFRAFGHDRVAVLDGGLHKWQREDRLVNAGVETVAVKMFSAELNREFVADKDLVHVAVTRDAADYFVIDSLSEAYFHGQAGDMYGYGRLGHITGAVNVPTDDLINPETNEFLSLPQLRQKFSSALEGRDRKMIAYCGGGIAATQNAFALHLLGHSEVAVYDGSLQEWSRDDSLPMSQ